MKKFLSVLLSIMMVLSTVSFALPGAVTVFDNAQDFVNAAYAEQDTASLADDVWTDPVKGIKLFVIDLDGDTGYVTNASKLSNLNNRIDGTNDDRDSNGMLVSELGRINPDVDETEASTFKISFKDGGTPTVEGTDDKYFKISSGQPSVMLANIDIGAGTYTYEFTYKTNTAVYGVHNDGCTILGGTLTQTAIDSTWSQLSYVVDSTEESWIRFRPTTAGSDNWCIDDIVVYYKPEGWGEEDEEPVADEWIHNEYGELVFNIDFEKNNTGNAVASSVVSGMQSTSQNVPVTNVGRVNPKYSANASNWAMFFRDVNSGTVTLGTDTEHGSYLQANGARADVSLYIEGVTNSGRDNFNNPFITEPGTYTLVYDYRVDTASLTLNPRFNTYSAATLTGEVNKWATCTFTCPEDMALSCLRLRSAGAVVGDTHYYDNIRLYYKPEGWTPPSEDGDDETDSEWKHETYGTKLFSIGFDKKNDVSDVTEADLSGIDSSRLDQDSSAGILISSVGKINPSLSASETSDYRVSLQYASAYGLGTADGGDKYFYFKSTNYKPAIYLGGFYDKDGEYTVAVTYRFDDKETGMVHDRVDFHTISGDDETGKQFDVYKGLSGETFGTLAVTYDTTWENSANANYQANYHRIVFYGTSASGSTNYSGVEEYQITDISMYYRDPADADDGSDDNTEDDAKWTDATYGTKLFSLNFDTKNDGTKVTESDLSGIDSGRLDQDLSAGILVSKVGCVNPSLPASQTGDYRVSLKDLSAFGLGTEDDRQYLYFKSTTEKPCLMLGGFNDKDGDYTIVFSYKYKANGTGFAHDRLYMHTHNLNVDKNYLSNETWVTAPYSFCTSDGDAFKKNFMRCVFYSSGHVFTGVEEFMIDEIAVYYKSKDYVSVTLDANGASGMSNVTVSDVPAEGITVAELFARISNKSGRQLLGLSKTADGTALPVGEKIVANDGDKLYMIWGNALVDKTITWTDSEKGYLLFDIDFETDKQYVRHADKLNTLGNVNTSIVNNDVWFLSLNYYQDVIPGSGDASYEPVEADIKYELVDGKYNKYLSVKPDGLNRWPQLGIMAYSSATSNNYLVFGGANGIYTIEYDLRAVIAEDSNYKYTSTVVDLATYDVSTGTYPTKTQGDSVSTGTLKNGTWEHLSGSLNNTDYDGLTRIKPCNQYPENPVSTGDEFHFDNFKLYWKPFEVSVTIDNSANPYADNVSLKIPTDKTMTAGELKAYVKSTGLMQLKGFAKTPGGIILADSTPIDFFGNLTYYAVWEEKDMTGWTDKDYGVLIYELDFNNASAFTDCSNASSYGRVNTNLAGSDAWTVSANGYNAVAVGDKSLQLTVGDSSRNPEFTVSAQTANEKLFASGGVYTVVYDAKLVSADNFATNTNFSAMSAVAKAGTNNDGSWTFRNLRSDIKVDDTAVLSEWATYVSTVDASNYDGLSDFSVRLTYSSTKPVSDKETLYIDNVRLFWRPDKVMLTVDPGENKVAEKKSFPISTSGVSVSEITSKIVDHGDMKLRGISLTKNGEPLTGTINTASDITVYALWDELGEVITEYSIEFEYDESSGNDIIWSNQGTNVNKGTGNGFARHKDGYGIFTFNAAKEHSAVWDANIQLTPFVNGNIPAGTVKGVMIRARFKNIPRFDCACSESVDKHVHEYKSGSSNTYNNANQMFQMYYATTETKSLNETQSLKFNFSLAEGSPYCDGWFTLYADVSDKDDFQNKIIDYVRLDFNNDVWDGTEIDIDYVRFIGDVSMAPETQQTSSMRTDKPTGIRFMASLEKEIVAESTSYGWIIARANSIKSASLKNSEFTYESALEKSIPTLRGCNYGEGREKALNFSEDDVNVYFTALLYNIPDTMYKDVLVARPFAVVGDTTYYGAPVARSVYDVAKSIKDGGFRGCTAAQQTYIQRVIDKVENA